MKLLRVTNLVKRFGGFTAIDDVNLTLAQNEVRLLMGPNGAGKSTFFRLLMGFTKPSAGEILLGDERIDRLPAHRRRRLGIAQALQTPHPIRDLTVEENLYVARNPALGVWSSVTLHSYDTVSREIVRDTLGRLNLSARARTPVHLLSHAERKLLEIGCGIVQQPALLLLDEPTAGLSQQEGLQLAHLVASLRREMALLIVVHDMVFARLIDEPVLLLHRGRIIRRAKIAALERDRVVREVYFGSSQ